MKFAVHCSPYMCEENEMYMLEAPNIRSVIMTLCGVEDIEEFNVMSDEELINHFNENNGDGQSYHTVMDVETGKVVLGGN